MLTKFKLFKSFYASRVKLDFIGYSMNDKTQMSLQR